MMDSKSTLQFLRNIQKQSEHESQHMAPAAPPAKPTLPQGAKASTLLALLKRNASASASASATSETAVESIEPAPAPEPAPAIVDSPTTEEIAETVRENEAAQYGGSDSDDEVPLYERVNGAISFPDIMGGLQIDPDPSQQAAIELLANAKSGCLMGAAGTGKTTTTRLLLNLLMNGDPARGIEPLRIERVNMAKYREVAHIANDDPDAEAYDEYDDSEEDEESHIPAIAFVAFTGQATQVLRKNLPEGWRQNAMTIHSCLGFVPTEYVREDGTVGMKFVPTFNAMFKMPWDVIIVDEASMVNLDLWHQLLVAAKPTTRFYFIGDLNQLPPPIGLGVFGFALTRLPTAELTVVHRQKDEAANRIVDTAWRVLKGQQPEFDDPKTNLNWRVIGFQLSHEARKAHAEILHIANAMSKKRVHASVDPAEPLIYDPWRDRIITTMNGFNADDPASLVGQFPLNEALSQMFADPSEPRVIIDAKRITKRFAVGYRVMATKNEAPDQVNRVTNGLTGKILEIYPNRAWPGDRRLVGPEDEVAENRKAMIEEAMRLSQLSQQERTAEELEALNRAADHFDLSFTASSKAQAEKEKTGGPASHVVVVQFDNGAVREYSMNSEVEQLMIAYSSTTHKTQGAEMPTAIVVVHHAQRRMLCRENLYTAITRASQRVILLYSQFGLQLALANQKISGNNLKQKIEHYKRYLGESESNNGLNGFRIVDVKLGYNSEGMLE